MTHFHRRGGKIEREEGEGRELGIPPTPISPHIYTSTPCIGGKQEEEEEERVWDSTFYPSFLKVEGVCIYIYYTYVHMMRKWFHLNIWRPYLHLPHLNMYFWSKFLHIFCQQIFCMFNILVITYTTWRRCEDKLARLLHTQPDGLGLG